MDEEIGVDFWGRMEFSFIVVGVVRCILIDKLGRVFWRWW